MNTIVKQETVGNYDVMLETEEPDGINVTYLYNDELVEKLEYTTEEREEAYRTYTTIRKVLDHVLKTSGRA